jgi:hypothetical protein
MFEAVSLGNFWAQLIEIPVLPSPTSDEMTLNYWMIVERYPNLKEEVGGSIPGCEISSLLDKRNLPGGQLHHVL